MHWKQNQDATVHLQIYVDIFGLKKPLQETFTRDILVYDTVFITLSWTEFPTSTVAFLAISIRKGPPCGTV